LAVKAQSDKVASLETRLAEKETELEQIKGVLQGIESKAFTPTQQKIEEEQSYFPKK